MSDKRKSDYECEMCKRVMHIGPCPHNRGILDEPLELGEPDKIEWTFVEKSKYEALLQEALKLEAALEHSHGLMPCKTCLDVDCHDEKAIIRHRMEIADNALFEFKKWKEAK